MQGVASHPVNRMEDPKRIIGKKWRAEEEQKKIPVMHSVGIERPCFCTRRITSAQQVKLQSFK
jgi:hypothetical protein